MDEGAQGLSSPAGVRGQRLRMVAGEGAGPAFWVLEAFGTRSGCLVSNSIERSRTYVSIYIYIHRDRERERERERETERETEREIERETEREIERERETEWEGGREGVLFWFGCARLSIHGWPPEF